MFDKRLMTKSKPVRSFLILSIMISIGIALLAVAQAWFFSRVAATVFLEGAVLKDTWNSLAMILLIIGLRAVLQWAGEISAFEAASLIKVNLREELLQHILSLGPIYARGERAGELITTVTEGIDALEDYFAKYLPQLLLAAGIPLLILGFVFPRDWKSGLILLITGPLIPVFMILIGKLAEKKSLQQWQNLSWMSAHFLDVLKGLPTLKVFGRSNDQTRVIQKVSDSFRKSTLSVLRVAFLSALMLEFLATISTALVAVTIGLRLVNGTLAYSDGLFLLLLAPEFYTPLRTLGLNFHAGLSGKNAAERIFEILELPLQAEGGMRSNPVIPANPSISFRKVSLIYQRGEPPALKDISFTLNPGEQIALVGPSGAGKTSVAQLLLGLINPASGVIEVNGAELKTMNLETWREQIAYVPQNPHLFAGTIADNIRLGRPEAAQSEVERAAKDASAHDFIMKLPEGYQTYLGEEGAGLSGGQAQRIALARAFLKDAPILILDEATSNLDLASESLIQEALERLLKGRTALMVAHRLDTVFHAQRILVMDKGQILEQGTHEELLKERGLYFRLLQQYRGETG